MPEKTKLEDYANMNNTGFAFIDLNEELKNSLKYKSEVDNFQPDCFYAVYNNEIVNFEFGIYEATEKDFELKKLYEKITKIFESQKPLIVKVKFDVTNGNNEHLYYDTIIRNCSIYKNKDETYGIIMNVGYTHEVNEGVFTTKGINILKIKIANESFDITSIYKGV